MMKKILSLLVMFSLLMGVSGVMALAGDNDQGGEGDVVVDWTFVIDPNPLLFGDMMPGAVNSITTNLAVGTSDLRVQSITINPNLGNVFVDANMAFSTDGGTTYVNSATVVPIDVPNGGNVNVEVQLTIPAGTKSEPFTGTITYTVMETP